MKWFLLFLLLPFAAFAHEFKVGDLEIVHPYIAPPPPMAKTAAAYLTIINHGAEPDKLTAIEIDGIGSAMLHETATSADGMTGMNMLDALDIPAGATVKLEAGQMHIMLTGLGKGFTDYDMVKAKLVFEHAGSVDIEFMVDPDGKGEEGDGHRDMGHAKADGPMSMPAMGDDAQQIEALLKGQFDRPEAPLSVAPITVQDTVAVAGWSQGDMAGRAFLRKDDQGWFIELCSGESLVQAATFVQMGLSPADADLLAAKVNVAEGSLGTELIARLSSFEGTVMIGREGMAEHGDSEHHHSGN